MKTKQQVKIDGRDLILTSAEKVYFPRNGFTKGEVNKFYGDCGHDLASSVWPSADSEALPGRHHGRAIL